MDMNEKMELTPEEKAAQAAWEAWNQKLQAITDPAQLKAMIAEREAKMEAWKIERTAMEADPAGSDAILRNAAQGVRFEEVGFYGARSAFFRARERFFIELDRELRRRDTHAS